MCLENAIEFCQRKLEVKSVYVTEGKLQITILIVSDIAKVQEGTLCGRIALVTGYAV